MPGGARAAAAPPRPQRVTAAARGLLKQLSVLTTGFAVRPRLLRKIPQGWAKRAGRDAAFARLLALLVVLWAAFGGRLRLRNGHLVLFHPRWVYDVACNFNFVSNWLTGAATYFLNALPMQTSPDWGTDPALTPERVAKHPDALPAPQLDALKAAVQKPTDLAAVPSRERDLVQLFDSLPAATTEQLLGRAWRGRIIRGGRFLDIVDALLIQPARLLGLKWGKRYRTPYTGDPLVFSFFDRVHIPQPLWGNVGMHAVDFRGRSHATMAYDHQPWHDYFAVLDDGAESGRLQLLGLWCHREKCGGWFTLTELRDVDVS